MAITADKLERLIFVKYLLQQAETSKELDRPLSSTTILTLHDAVECFLQLSYEHLTNEAKLSNNGILANYTESINKVLSEINKPLINKAFIKRINELRNQLKHSTIFIDAKNIQNLFSETELFFADFTEIIFNFSFSEVSLIQLISNEIIRKYLQEAEFLIKSNKFHTAMLSVSKAFYELEELGTKVKDKYGENMLSKHHIVDYLLKYHASLEDEPDKILRRNLQEIAEDINRIQDDLHELKKIISLSVDLKKYNKFRNTIPYVYKLTTGGPNATIYWSSNKEKEEIKYTIEQVKFCFDFVVETALKHNAEEELFIKTKGSC